MRDIIKINSKILDRVKTHTSSFYTERNVPVELKVEEILDNMLFLFELTKKELKNYFTFEEVTYLCDSHNGVLYFGNESIKEYMIAEYKNYLRHNEYKLFDTDEEAEKIGVLDKLNKLTEFQAYVVYTQVRTFWNKENCSIDELHELFFIDRNKVNE